VHGGIGDQNHANKPIQTVLYNTDDSWLCRYPFCLIADNLFLHWAYITKPEIFKQIYIDGVIVCRNLSRLQKKTDSRRNLHALHADRQVKDNFQKNGMIVHITWFWSFCSFRSFLSNNQHRSWSTTCACTWNIQIIICSSLWDITNITCNVWHWQEVSVNVLLRMVLLVT
jgi:hypothetical protein